MKKATALSTVMGARLLHIERLVQSSEGCTFVDFQRSTNASAATLKRDLQLARKELCAPIYYDRFTKRYRLKSPWKGVTALIQEHAQAVAAIE